MHGLLIAAREWVDQLVDDIDMALEGLCGLSDTSLWLSEQLAQLVVASPSGRACVEQSRRIARWRNGPGAEVDTTHVTLSPLALRPARLARDLRSVLESQGTRNLNWC